MDSTFTLTTTKKNARVEVCEYLMQVANDMDYLSNVITANMVRIYCHDPTFK